MRPIKLNDTTVTGMLEKIKQHLSQNNYNAFSGNPAISYTLPQQKRPEPVTLNYTAKAWLKMRTLVEKCEQEIAWHGVVHTNEDHTRFDVVDILVYPQTVTGATVNTDDAKYEQWHNALNNEQFNNLRLQGHSHVRMPVSPSGTDIDTYMNILDIIRETSYYIFVITNKQGNTYCRIFDKAHNVVYDNADIKITVEDLVLADWYKEIEKTFISKHATATHPRYANDHSQFGINTYGSRYVDAPITEPANDPFFASDDPNDANTYLLDEQTPPKRGRKKNKKKE